MMPGMSHKAKILADSISPAGVRLTTFEVTFPRIILAEFNTHRVFSRNSASSRAIPVEKMIRMVMEDPYVPTHWGKNQKGMQADEEVYGVEKQLAESEWLLARDAAMNHARQLLEIGIHKQITNRLLEPFMWHTVIVTATEWSNFFHLRDNAAAHPEIQKIARMMRELHESTRPTPLAYGEWHAPLVDPQDDFDPVLRPKVSVGRCARVSYLTHDGRRDPAEDVALHGRLLKSGHLSPFEHVAKPIINEWSDREWHRNETNTFCGNFRGWIQYRKEIPGEEDILAPRG